MVSSVSNIPYSYYNVLNPVPPATKPVPVSIPEAPNTPEKSDPVGDAVRLSQPAVLLMQQLLDLSNNSNNKNSGLNGLFGSSGNNVSSNVYQSILSAAYSNPAQQNYDDSPTKPVPVNKVLARKFDAYQAVSNLSTKHK